MIDRNKSKPKVVPIRPDIKKQKSESPHLDMARQLLASAKPAVPCACAEMVERLTRHVAQLNDKVSSMEARSSYAFIKKLGLHVIMRTRDFSTLTL